MRKSFVFFILVMVSTFPAFALDEGKYQKVENPQPVAVPGKIEVMEVFLYSCPHCYSLEPLIEQWQQSLPEDVNFVRLPAVFRDDSVPYAKAYYIMELLKLGKGTHGALFSRIHKNQQNLNDPVALQKFFTLEGVEKEKFEENYNSFTIDLLVRKAAELTRGYRISAVPTIVVNGKYLVTANLAGGQEQMIKVVDELIAKERSGLEVTGTKSGVE